MGNIFSLKQFFAWQIKDERSEKITELRSEIEQYLDGWWIGQPIGIKKPNFDKIIEILERLHNELEDEAASIVLADLYYCLNDEVNFEKWSVVAANNGHVNAQFNLGRHYGRKGDLKNSVYWFSKAIEQGDVQAITSLGFAYEINGKPKEAEECYLKAAEKGEPLAQNNLACLYYEGKLGEKYEEKALYWIEKAILQNEPNSFDTIKEMRDAGVKGADELIRKYNL